MNEKFAIGILMIILLLGAATYCIALLFNKPKCWPIPPKTDKPKGFDSINYPFEIFDTNETAKIRKA